MKNSPLSALGAQTEAKWIVENGIPFVETRWWESDMKIREVIIPMVQKGIFKRSITLDSADLVGIDTVAIRLSLPASTTLRRDNVLIGNDEDVSMVLVLPRNLPTVVSKTKNQITSGLIVLSPSEKKTIDTRLIVSVPGIGVKILFARTRNLSKILSEAE